ncbi:MAG: MBL fold metallo-hydrolase [Candidatus Aminicenantes bacterium]|nr:MBL fold metallo-hydrolase [Candidatus Aminicenantes bacterium]MCK4758420.1 MBL fold metallo-hydrolase [Candidatus Aminicenantes bacterium]
MNNKHSLQMTVVYDNNAFDENLKADWGFSCLIRGLEKSVLFDSGTNGKILLSNMEKLGIHPGEIDTVFLSHEHKDHTGGLEALLNLNSRVEVWLPNFFSSSFKNKIKNKGSTVREVTNFQEICEGAYTSGIIEGWIKEQSLILNTEKGLILITGCAHPRIVKIIDRVKELLKKNIHLVFGGFHMGAYNENEINEIIGQFQDSRVKKVGPCHCTGDEARRLFAEEYKDDFIEIGVGKVIKVQ